MTCYHGGPGDRAPLGHSIEHFSRGGDITAAGVAGDQSVPRDDVPRGHLVKQATSDSGAAELEVHVDEGVADEEVGIDASLEDEGVRHLTVGDGRKASAGLEDGGEGELVGKGVAGEEEEVKVAQGEGPEMVEGQGS